MDGLDTTPKRVDDPPCGNDRAPSMVRVVNPPALWIAVIALVVAVVAVALILAD